MDPGSLVVTALIAGATRCMEGAAENSLKEAYAGLKGLVKRFFAERPAATDALERIENIEGNPEKYKPLLEDYVQESGAAQDADIQEAAQKLLALVDPDGARSGQYNITVKGDVRADRGGIAAAYINNARTGHQAAAGDEPHPS